MRQLSTEISRGGKKRRRAAATCAIVAAVACAACGHANGGADTAKTAPPATVPKANDNLRISMVAKGERQLRILRGQNLPDIKLGESVITPTVDLSELDLSEIADAGTAGMVVATVHSDQSGTNVLSNFGLAGTQDADLLLSAVANPLDPSDPSEQDGTYKLTATLVAPNKPPVTLKVQRTTYDQLKKSDIPATARWDWEMRPAQQDTSPAMGIRCGDGWCLIGTVSEGDVQDTNTGTDVVQRVPGWYDVDYVKNAQGIRLSATIYPTMKLKKFTKQRFRGEKKKGLHVADVTVGNPILGYKTTKLFLRTTAKFDVDNSDTDPQHKDGDWQLMNATQLGDRIHHPFPVIGAARWGKSVYSTKGIVDFDDAWFRCASGCCSSSLEGAY